MKMTKEEFIEVLKLEANKQNIELTVSMLDKLYQYKGLLVEWNEKINLTTITEDYDVIIKHIVDSLIVTKYINDNQSVIDIGTGAGLPGIIISIYFEGRVKITLLDSLNKRIMFLDEVVSKLNLRNINTLHSRAEEACHKKECREAYDIVLARAVASLNILSEYLAGYVKVDGKCIFMKAGGVQEELDQAKNAFDILQLMIEKKGSHEIEYLGDKLSRTIIVARKTKKLNNIYPRSFAKIKKSPL